MSDIFISYSRKDSEQALGLAERLRAEGMGVWIDQNGIVGAEQWATEIVEGIRACSTFILLLSPNSIESENVLRELSLASEKRKRVLPVEIAHTILPSSFEYPLAGLQRVPFAEFDRILHAHKYGVGKEIKKDERKSLMILPFEDHSPEQDNEWFANGIVSELINALSNVRSLRLSDNQATKEFRKYTGQLTTYASEMNIRYFVQGDVRKFGAQIKISARLLDIETGDHLWQDSMKGTMDDIFDIQEKVAEKVVEGLKVHLVDEEKKKLAERGTESAEAYECYLRANDLSRLSTHDGYLHAIALYDHAIRLDAGFFNAKTEKAFAIIELYKYHDRNISLLRDAEVLLRSVENAGVGKWEVHGYLSVLYLIEGRREDAESEHQKHIAVDDGCLASRSQLGFFCFHARQYDRALYYYESCVSIDPLNRTSLWNALINAKKSKENAAITRWGDVAIAVLRSHLRLYPDDANVRHQLASIYHWLIPSRKVESLAEINIIEQLPNLDAHIQYRVAVLLAQEEEYDRALVALKKAHVKGYPNINAIDLATSAFAPLTGNPEFEAFRKEAQESSCT